MDPKGTGPPPDPSNEGLWGAVPLGHPAMLTLGLGGWEQIAQDQPELGSPTPCQSQRGRRGKVWSAALWGAWMPGFSFALLAVLLFPGPLPTCKQRIPELGGHGANAGLPVYPPGGAGEHTLELGCTATTA